MGGSVSYVRINLDVAITAVAFFLYSHPDLVVSGPNFTASLVGRNSADARHFKLPFTVTASPVTCPSRFNVSHFSAELSGRKRRRFYREGNTIRMSRIRFLWSMICPSHIFPCVNFAFVAGRLKCDFSLGHSPDET